MIRITTHYPRTKTMDSKAIEVQRQIRARIDEQLALLDYRSAALAHHKVHQVRHTIRALEDAAEIVATVFEDEILECLNNE